MFWLPSSLLFLLTTFWVRHLDLTLEWWSRRYHAEMLNDLDFADDIALLESSMSWAQSQLTRTADATGDLVISTPKTEFMTINCHPQPPLQVYGTSINHVTDFKYLGSMMASSASDLKRRNALAWTAFWKLERLWKSPSIPISTKVKLFNTTCITVWLRVLDHLQGHGGQNQFFWHVLRSNHVEHQANR